ncbi:MAG: PilZ domain-containing protein [Bacillota bacterium]
MSIKPADLLSPGAKIEVRVVGDLLERFHHCRVHALGDTWFTSDVPLYQRHYLSMEPGTRIKIRVVQETGVYWFSSEVLSVIHKKVPEMRCVLPKELERIQRRNFVRLEVGLPVNVSTCAEEEGDEKISFVATTFDISGGGLGLLSDIRLQPETLIQCLMEIQGREVRATGRVVRCVPSDLDAERFRLGVQFVDIRIRDQDWVCRFVLQKQLEQRRLGLA